ncbi:Na(+)/dicarboxylate cotransporter 3-like [Glandiceps talaboti]
MGCREKFEFLPLVLAKRNLFIVILTPLLLLPVPLCYPTPAGKCGYVVVVMMVFLVLEALPLPITGMIPLVSFPLLGIQDYQTVAKSYAVDTILFIMAVMIVATAVESTNLHRRIVLRCLLLLGSNPYRILIGLMCSGFFLSMWVPNIAVIAMMMPIAIGINKELGSKRILKEIQSTPSQQGHHSELLEMTNIDIENETNKVEDQQKPEGYRAGKYILLGLLYSVNLGGSATLIGTIIPPVANGQMVIEYGPDSTMTYGKWLAFALPLELLCLVSTYLWIVFLMWRITKKNRKNNKYADVEEMASNGEIIIANAENSKTGVHDYIKQECIQLGSMKWAEACTLVIIIVLTLLWCFADLDSIDGWFSLFPDRYPSLTCVTSGFAILFFIVPRDFEQFKLTQKSENFKAILDWKYVVKKVPWGINIVLGAYFALGNGIKATGVFAGIETLMAKGLADVDDWIIVLAITVIAAVLTEFTGNVAILLVFFPIVTALAKATNTHPHLFVIPLTLACNMALMLPIATAPNLVFYSYKEVTTGDMIKCGWMVNVLSLILLNLLINTYGYVIFDYSNNPTWASTTTTTLVMTNFTTTL